MGFAVSFKHPSYRLVVCSSDYLLRGTRDNGRLNRGTLVHSHNKDEGA